MITLQRVFALVTATTFSVLAYPSLNRVSDNILGRQEAAVAAIDTRTTTDIFQEYFGTEENVQTPVISAELKNRLENGVWYNFAETDQGNSRQEVLNQARSKKLKAVSLSRTSKSNSYSRSSQSSSQSKRYRNKTILDRTRNRLANSANSRIRQSMRVRQLNTAKIKRQRDKSRGYLHGTQRRSVYDRTRRFRHTRSGITPSS